jgi:ketosteroid isomerase-like protein
MIRRTLALAFALSLAAAGAAAAQTVPGVEEIDWGRQHREYNANILKEFQSLMRGWREGWVAKDVRRLAREYSPAAYVVFEDGNPVQGPGEIQKLFQARLADKGDIRTGLNDFVASDRLAYAIGPYWYELKEPDGFVREVTGTYVAVMIRERGRWWLRSQVFTQTPPEPAPASADN